MSDMCVCACVPSIIIKGTILIRPDIILDIIPDVLDKHLILPSGSQGGLITCQVGGVTLAVALCAIFGICATHCQHCSKTLCLPILS